MKDIAALSDRRRIVTLNVQHGGGSVRIDRLIRRLLGYQADVLVVTEFRANTFGQRLIADLEHAGYATSHPDVGQRQNSVLVASRGFCDRGRAFGTGLDPRHLVRVDLGWSVLLGVYMPQNVAKPPYWEALITDARRDGIDFLIGDFNTGNNDLDKAATGTRFVGPEMPGRLIESGYVDLWRSSHPDIREYSWFSPGARNGFRLDHVFATPELAQRVVACEFDQTPRELTETDHAALVISMTK